MISPLKSPQENQKTTPAAVRGGGRRLPRWRLGVASELGPRPDQQDRARAVFIRAGSARSAAPGTWVLAVHDGAGGVGGGGVASATAEHAVLSHIAAGLAGGVPDELLRELLLDAFAHANRAVLQATRGDPATRGAATTATVALVRGRELVVAWVGDSPCWTVPHAGRGQHGAAAVPLTREHTEAQELVDLGLLSPAEARRHRAGHTLTRYLGCPTGVAPEVMTKELAAGDAVVLASDGVGGVLDASGIARTVQRASSGSESPAVALVHSALRAGSVDNTTAICLLPRLPSPGGGTPRLLEAPPGHQLAAARAIHRLRQRGASR